MIVSEQVRASVQRLVMSDCDELCTTYIRYQIQLGKGECFGDVGYSLSLSDAKLGELSWGMGATRLAQDVDRMRIDISNSAMKFDSAAEEKILITLR